MNKFTEGMIGVFSIPVIFKQAKDDVFDNIQNELLSVIEGIDFEHIDGWSKENCLLSPNPFNSNILVDNNCNYFLKFLDDCIVEYMGQVTGRRGAFGYQIQESWITKTLKGQYAQDHQHGDADISGVYYINTNGEDGNLMFDNIHSQLCGNYVFANLPGKQPMPLENGLLMLWPGPLRHGTAVNKTDNERMSLSFNVFIGRNGYRE